MKLKYDKKPSWIIKPANSKYYQIIHLYEDQNLKGRTRCFNQLWAKCNHEGILPNKLEQMTKKSLNAQIVRIFQNIINNLLVFGKQDLSHLRRRKPATITGESATVCGLANKS